MLVRKKEKQTHNVKLIIKDGKKTSEMAGGAPEMGAYIGYLIRDGATKVEVTIPITCELNLKKTLEGLREGKVELENVHEIKRTEQSELTLEERHDLYDAVRDAYIEMKKMDALQVMDWINKTYFSKAIKCGEKFESGELGFYIAAVLKVMGEVSRNIDPDTLSKTEREIFEGAIIKNLEGMKRFLGLLVPPSSKQVTSSSFKVTANEIEAKVARTTECGSREEREKP